jgi:arylsulfatase A
VSRAQLITGQYPFRNGAIELGQLACSVSPRRSPAMPALLREAGYATALAGKWHLANDRTGAGTHPRDWGFQRWLLMTDGSGPGYYHPRHWEVDGVRQPSDGTTYFPDLIDAWARSFIRDNRDRPFFLQYAMTNPHIPILPTPLSRPGASQRRLYADNVAYIDLLVGRLRDELRSLGIERDTLLLFTADNGSWSGGQGTVRGRRLIGAKSTMAEGGSQVPLIAHWPGTIAPGRICDDLIDFSDILPTLVELAGGKLPRETIVDGRTFAPQLRGERGAPRSWAFVQLGHYYHVRGDRYRLDELGRLYDLHDAPFAERLVPPGTEDPSAAAARRALADALTQLAPQSGPTWEQWEGFRFQDILWRGPGTPRPDTSLEPAMRAAKETAR